jgi:uncharacterized protein (DUF433 family)
VGYWGKSLGGASSAILEGIVIREYVEQRDGGYYLAESRVALESIVFAWRRGEFPESIRQSFPTLSLEQVYGAITFYLANKQAVNAHLVEIENEWEEFAREHPLPPDLRNKIEHAREHFLARRL